MARIGLSLYTAALVAVYLISVTIADDESDEGGGSMMWTTTVADDVSDDSRQGQTSSGQTNSGQGQTFSGQTNSGQGQTSGSTTGSAGPTSATNAPSQGISQRSTTTTTPAASATYSGCPAPAPRPPAALRTLDKVFIHVANFAFVCIAVTGIMLGVSLAICFFGWCIEKCRRKPLPCLHSLYPVMTSYFGLTYLTLIFTVPFFGKPREGCKYPEVPHLSPEKPGASKMSVIGKLILNGVLLALAAYLLLLALLAFVCVLIILPCTLIAMFTLLMICRMADVIDRKARENADKAEQKKKEANGGNKEETQGPATQKKGCKFVCMKIVFELWRVVLFAIGVLIKMFFDFLLLLSVSATWGSIGLPTLNFSFDFDPTFGFTLPCLRIPVIHWGCMFTAQLNGIVILLVSVIIVAVVISSDIMTMLYDRIKRSALIKLDISKKSERCDAIKHTLMVKFLEACTFICWKCVELLTSVSAAAFLGMLRVFLDMDASSYLTNDDCKLGLYIISKLISLYIMLVCLVQVFRVGTGHVQRNYIYICAVPLTKSQLKLFQWTQVRALIGVTRMSVGSFLMPFVNLGLRGAGIDSVREAIGNGHVRLSAKELAAEEKEEAKIRRDKAKAEKKLSKILYAYCDTFFYSVFGAGSAVKMALQAMEDGETGKNDPATIAQTLPLMNLNVGGASVKEAVEVLHNAVIARKEKTACQLYGGGLLSLFLIFFGVFNKRVMVYNRALGRSMIWQSQMESVQMASANYFGITLQAVPFVGVFLGKVTMYLNEHFTFVMTSDRHWGMRSLRFGGSPKSPDKLKPSTRQLLLYFCSFVKVSLLLAAFFTGKIAMCFGLIFLVAIIEGAIGNALTEHSRLGKASPESA